MKLREALPSSVKLRRSPSSSVKLREAPRGSLKQCREGCGQLREAHGNSKELWAGLRSPAKLRGTIREVGGTP
eukprot:4785047-Alexandrium_andersonii.AAC.1